MKSATALELLLAGNKRYQEAKPITVNRSRELRVKLAREQRPFAIILGCSDSRVPVEILFDQGLGSLFVVRVAGNILDRVVEGSIEFAVQGLKVQLIMVLGHQNCGAVNRALSTASKRNCGSVCFITEAIAPVIKKAEAQEGNLTNNVVKANVCRVVKKLSTNPFLAQYIAANNLKIVGAYYDLEEGSVALI
jgi:carbonic anhydrase